MVIVEMRRFRDRIHGDGMSGEKCHPNVPAPPKRCQYDPKGWLMGTPYHSFSTP